MTISYIMLNTDNIDGIKQTKIIKDDTVARMYRASPRVRIIKFPSVVRVWESALEESYSQCFNLIEARFPELRVINNNGMASTFIKCQSLENITFPKLEKIDDNGMTRCFFGCSSLKSIDFPNLTSVGNNAFTMAFRDCVSLENISFPKLTDVGDNAFMNAWMGCTSISSLPFRDIESVGDSAFKSSFEGIGITEVKLLKLKTVKSGGFESAFKDCNNLKIVDIRNMTSVEVDSFKNAFSGCDSLTDIYINKKYKDKYNLDAIPDFIKNAFPNPSIVCNDEYITYEPELFDPNKWNDYGLEYQLKLDILDESTKKLIREELNGYKVRIHYI